LQENLSDDTADVCEGDPEIYDSINETPRMALVAALTDAVRELLAEGDVTAARVALKALEEFATLAPPNGNVMSIHERRKREK
jgi:N-acetylglucosamine kinase-like BadF-type ATPase